MERLINHFAVYKEIDFEDALMFLDNKNNESYGTSINEIMENKANEAGDSIDYDRINRHVMKRLQMRSKGDIQKITESVMEVCKGTLDVPNDPESLRLQAQKEAVFCEKNKAVITESERFFELLKKVRERQKSYFDNEDYIRLSQSYLFDIDICEKDPKSCETDD